jgi:peptidoglycan/LPS O-acetylase OafA/YrhL
MQKLKSIEFLRTFLILTIILLHMFINRGWCLSAMYPDIDLYSFLHKATVYANCSVEGFFIVAGFLLVLTFNRETSVCDFIKKKYIRLSPVIAFSVLVVILGAIFKVVSFKPIPDILSVLLLNNFGICWVIPDNPVLWFISALFGCLILYFCIIKFFSKKQIWIITSFVILGYLLLEILQGGKFSHPLQNYYGILNIGFLRAVGGIGTGCLLGLVYENNKDKIANFKPAKITKGLITATEILSFAFLIWWTLIPHSFLNNIYFVINFVLLFSLFVMRKGYFSSMANSDVWVFLGKYQYSLFVIHYVVIKLFGYGLWKNIPEFVFTHPQLPILIMFVTVLVLGVLTYHFIEEPCSRLLKHKFLK